MSVDANRPGAECWDLDGGHYQPGQQGLAFRDGKLYSFLPARVVVLRGGDDPAAWAKVAEGKGRPGWFSSRVLADEVFGQVLDRYAECAGTMPVAMDGNSPVLANGQRLFPFYRQYVARDLAVGRFVSSVPESLLPVLSTIREGRWQLYAFLARCGDEALQLAESHLPIAFALAHAGIFHRVARPLRSARALMSRKRREIAAWLGFPDTASTVRLLGRVEPRSLTVLRLLRLRHVLGKLDQEQLGLLRHAPRLSGELLDSFTAFRQALTPGLVEEMSDRSVARTVLRKLIRLSAALRNTGRTWHPVRSTDHLDSTLAQAEERWHGADRWRLFPEIFPPPPVIPASDSGIEPIRTFTELEEEGREQHNCCRDYAPSILEGVHYLYRVTAPVRATLSLCRGQDGCWRPEQLLEACNREVPARAQSVVLDRIIDNCTVLEPLTPPGLPTWPHAAEDPPF